jgi:hypothetical protein
MRQKAPFLALSPRSFEHPLWGRFDLFAAPSPNGRYLREADRLTRKPRADDPNGSLYQTGCGRESILVRVRIGGQECPF